MTEAEWLGCNDPQKMLRFVDPQAMLKFLRRRVSERKLRLFACASVRQLWHLLTDERGRRAVEMSESFADGNISEGELASVREEAVKAAVGSRGYAGYAALDAAEAKGRKDRLRMAAETAVYVWEWEVDDDGSVQQIGNGLHQHSEKRREAQQAIQCHILRDIFGDPFRPVSLDPAWLIWLGGLLVSMAQRMYDRRDFTDMPVLADALEEAGCSDLDILRHCREPGPHVRGCWVVDLLLGKE